MSCPDDCLQPRAKYGDILLVNDLGPLREGSLYVFYPTSDDALRSNPIPTMLLVETGRFVGREGADRIIVEKSDPDERLIWRESDYKAHEVVCIDRASDEPASSARTFPISPPSWLVSSP
jgi:hypothetical protein